ncbi:succinylglutamate desuccinylase/aspartoacylase family protein [Azospirillum oryzae]|uniref:succinylglutamate desuccinylase/aspartoacylase family protein n=1 Tax=Azospirillum oryzae TaxID=286727 RepID=UPI001B3BEBD2|nr:succinylglutamate desuccinylase/aspartoacylase family protein [Azospirillum oryzae]GLR81870.1 hypothetical protein GCM10007856_45610 [Azospirillum oryzae]
MNGIRTFPIDKGNLNRMFPGARDGTPTQRIAHYIETVLIAGRLYDPHAPWREPVELRFRRAGVVVCVRSFAHVQPGDCLVHLASDTART